MECEERKRAKHTTHHISVVWHHIVTHLSRPTCTMFAVCMHVYVYVHVHLYVYVYVSCVCVMCMCHVYVYVYVHVIPLC